MSNEQEAAIILEENSVDSIFGDGTSVPSSALSRNDFGLLSDTKYYFKPDGRVDWRKMIDPQYIVPNKEKTSETDISKIEDKNLLVLLFGYRGLAEIRGHEGFYTDVKSVGESHIQAITTIRWIGNYETGGRAICTTGCGDAHPGNTTDFSVNYLTSIAENRSFVRAVRNFLQIPIVGQDEVGPSSPPSDNGNATGKPIDTLKGLLESRSVSFTALKNRMIKENFNGAENWENLQSIPSADVYTVIQRLSEIYKQKDEKAKSS